MNSAAENFEHYLATAAEMLIAEGTVRALEHRARAPISVTEAAEIPRTSTAKVEETGYDNWNGGTTTWTIYLLLVPAAYARLASKREALEDQIDERLKPIFDQFTSDWYRVTIAPRVDPHPDWRHARDDVRSPTAGIGTELLAHREKGAATLLRKAVGRIRYG